MSDWTRLTEDDDGNLIMLIPAKIIIQLGWKCGDVLTWETDPYGGVYLKKSIKQDDTEFVVVNAVQSFATKYVVEVPVGRHDLATKLVSSGEAREFSQRSLGEFITQVEQINEYEIIPLCDRENDYCTEWTDALKMKNFVDKAE
jgi:hypothetical protein